MFSHFLKPLFLQTVSTVLLCLQTCVFTELLRSGGL
jgi:hypothetical protein